MDEERETKGRYRWGEHFWNLVVILAHDAHGTVVGWAQYCPVFNSYILALHR